MTPTVSFVVPCYRLGHLLAECVRSILSQSYQDFELLVMDDCSPDCTPDVARSFQDDRVRHVRNEPNIGHLRNYNKGIGLARGTHVWLISADDCLRQPYVLERFVQVMDRHSTVGYVFCPVMKFQDNRDLYVYGSQGERDTIFNGHRFLRRLAGGNCVPAASGMARKACYERQGMFPLDLPFAGDWYIWAIFALFSDVAYLGEPMVGWRVHADNMTHRFQRQHAAALVTDELAVRWRLKRTAEMAGLRSIGRVFSDAIALDYSTRVSRKLSEDWPFGLTEAEFERSLDGYSTRPDERAAIRAVVYAALGDHYVGSRDLARARELYGKALRCAPASVRTFLKHVLVHAGQPGLATRETIVAIRDRIDKCKRRIGAAGVLGDR